MAFTYTVHAPDSLTGFSRKKAKEGDSYSIHASGALVVITEGTRYTYAPTSWFSIEESEHTSAETAFL